MFHSVKLIANDAIIGIIVNNKKPISHGEIKSKNLFFLNTDLIFIKNLIIIFALLVLSVQILFIKSS